MYQDSCPACTSKLVALVRCSFCCLVFSPERADYTKKTLGVHYTCFLWNVFYGVQMQRLFDHWRLHPDSLPQTANMGCRQSWSSSENANVIMEIEGGFMELRNFLSQPALEDTCQGALWKRVLQLAAERSEWINADDHAFITPSFLKEISYCLPRASDFSYLVVLRAILYVWIFFSPRQATLLLPVVKEHWVSLVSLPLGHQDLVVQVIAPC